MSKLAITGITGKSGQFFWKELLANETLVKEKWPDGINLLSRNVSKLDNIKKGSIDTFFYEGGRKMPLLKIFAATAIH